MFTLHLVIKEIYMSFTRRVGCPKSKVNVVDLEFNVITLSGKVRFP